MKKFWLPWLVGERCILLIFILCVCVCVSVAVAVWRNLSLQELSVCMYMYVQSDLEQLLYNAL